MGRGGWPVANVLSLARLGLSLLFASLAFQSIPTEILACIYAAAAVTDVADGYFARRLQTTSYFGTVLDLVGDKCLTLVSAIYAGIRGVPMLPLAIIATREIVVLGMRLVVVDGAQLLPTSRLFGGIMATALWGTTLYLVATPGSATVAVPAYGYAGVALVYAANLALRVRASRARIKAAYSGTLETPE